MRHNKTKSGLPAFQAISKYMTADSIAMYLQLFIVFVSLFQVVITEKCATPNQEEAECVSIYSCKILIDALKTKESEAIEFVRQSICKGRESDRMVCCGSTSRFVREKCVTPNQEEAECVSIYSCKILVDALKTKKSEAIEFVKKSKCEGREADRMVCCGSTSKFLKEKCVTPNNETAECVSIHSCKILLDALIDGTFKKEQSNSIEFVRESKCGGKDSDNMVCCGSTSRFSAPMMNKNADKDKLIPDRRYCGYQHSDDYFRNETAIGINEFPWLAGLVYKEGNKTTIRCSGTLITNRYVLTAAYCIFIQYATLIGVRLGEYNVRTDEDCTEDSSFYECSDPPQNFDIEKMIPHPEFNERKELPGGQRSHNIGLLRLSKKVQYSDYIRPICLPTAGTMFAKPGDTLLTSGWGILFSNRSQEIKKKVHNVLMSKEECVAAMNELYHPPIKENHFCTKVLENEEFDCETAFGAPAIFSFRKQWHQEGVLSIFWACDSSVPVLNVKVVTYLDWIEENIEP